MAPVVKATELAPAAYAEAHSSKVLKENDLSYDLGCLMASDSHPFTYENETELVLHVRENVQLLINAIFDLPTVQSEVGLCAKLPAPVTVIPREKPCPKPKVETRWEAFAKEKGITNKKKSRMTWDEEKESYAPAWGYKRARDDLQDWACEIKPGQDLYADPWTEKAQAKASRVDKNTRQNLNNSAKGRGHQSEKLTPTGVPLELLRQDNSTERHARGKANTTDALKKVQFSTASMGNFDQQVANEPLRKKAGVRTVRTPVVGCEGQERERSLTVLDKILGKDGNSTGKRPGENPVDEEGRPLKRPKMKNITKGHAKKVSGGKGAAAKKGRKGGK